MKKLRRIAMPAFAISILFLISAAAFAQSPESEGKYTKKIKSPVNAHINSYRDGGKIKRIRGRLVLPDDEVPPGSIVSVYRISGERSEFIYSYLPGVDGKFDFKDLEDGKYVLKTGTTDGYYNQVDVDVILSRRDADSSDEDLEIWMEVGT